MCHSGLELHTYGTWELLARNMMLGRAPLDLAACSVSGTNPKALGCYPRAQGFPVSRRGSVMSLLGDLGQASSLLRTHFLLSNCGNDSGPHCYRVLLHPEDKHSLRAGYCCAEQQLAAVTTVY